jgi:hypothetical protein
MVASRLANAAITGAIDYAAGGDLQHAGGAALGGAALGNPTTLGKAAIEGGENVGKKISSLLATGKATQEEAGNLLSARGATVDGAATKPESTGDYPPGNPAEAPKPNTELEKADVKTPGISTPGGYGGRTAAKPNEDVAIGNPGSKPMESNREGGKDAIPEGAPGASIESGRAPAPLGTLDPGVEAVLRPKPEEPAAPRQQAEQEQPGAPRAAAAERPAETVKSDPLVESLKQEQAKRAADAENPPSEFDQAAQKAVEAGKKYGTLGRQARQQDEPVTGGRGREPPREPPPPTEPPEPGPKDARLNKPPLLESAPENAFRSLQRTFAPEFMSPASERGAAAIRKGLGEFQGLNDKWEAKMEPHYKALEKLEPKDMDAFIDHVEGGKSFPEWKMPAELKGVADDIQAMTKEYKEAIAKQAENPEEARAWSDQYLTHIYKPEETTPRTGGGGIRGSGGSLKEKKYETYAEAKEAGLERGHYNPLDALKAYRTELGKHLALRQAVDELHAEGHIKYSMPEGRQGASGQLSSLRESGRIHKDWEPVPQLSMGGRTAFMPRDMANIFNNHLSSGLMGGKYTGPIYQKWREATNRMTGTELGLFNGFHFFVTGNESMLSNQARGISELARGVKNALSGNMKDAGIELTAGGKSLLTSPVSFLSNYREGRRMMAAITGDDRMIPVFGEKGQAKGLNKLKALSETDRIKVTAAQEAGVAPIGRSFAPDVNMVKGEGFLKSITRGSLGREMREMAQHVKDSPFKNVPMAVWDGLIGRSLQTLSEPLFGHYIPALKFGSLMKNADSFIRQSKIDVRTPQGKDTLVKFLRKESNAMDVRMGEANANNMFMNKSIQQAGYGLLRSFSWTKGTITALTAGPGGVAKTLAEGVKNRDMKGAMEKLGNKLDMTHKDYDPNLAYSIAFPFGIALMGALYEGYKTRGELPSSFKDLYLPRTGGKIPGFAGRGDVEERLILPGYHKEVKGMIQSPSQEVSNKLNATIQTIKDQVTGRDTFGLPIVRPNATLTENLTDRGKHALEKLSPLMLKNVLATPPEGSNISKGERVFGFKQASKAITDPENTQKFLDKKYEADWDQKMRTKLREEQGGRGGPSKSDVRATHGTANKTSSEPAPPSTLKRAPAADGWIRDPIQRPPPR